MAVQLDKDKKILEYIHYYKKKLERGRPDKAEAARVLQKLAKVRMSPDYMKQTGIHKTIKPYLDWPGEAGDLAKGLEAAWRSCDRESSMASRSGKTSHSPENPEKEGDRSRLSKPAHSQPTSNNKRKVEVKVVKNAANVCAEYEEELFAPVSIVKRPSDVKPAKKGERRLNGEKKTEKMSSSKKAAKVGSSLKESGSSKSGDSNTNKSEKVAQVANSNSLGDDSPADRRSAGPDLKRSKSASKSKDVPAKKRTKKLANAATEEGFDASIASFDECLGIPDYTRLVKKKKTVPVITSQPKAANTEIPTKKAEKTAKVQTPLVIRPERSSSPLVQSSSANKDASVTSTLPEIQPNYKPMRFSMPDIPGCRPKKMHAEMNDGSFLTTRNNRTLVFSGRRQGAIDVPRLFDIAIKVLQENITDLTYTGGIPFYILEPVFQQCSPIQLYNIEYYNPYILDSTGDLWKKHCERDFKGKELHEHESWRDMYLRETDERDAKLKRITANISASVAKTLPVRKTKLAFLDSAVKPPRDIARQQAKLGIVQEHSRPVTVKSAAALKQQLVKPPPGSDYIKAPSVPDPGSSASGNSQQKADE